MIKIIWNWYIGLILHYAKDIDSEFKHLIANLVAIVPVTIIIYVVFFFILGSSWHIIIVLISIGYGRLFLAFVMEKNNCNFGKGYSPFLRFMSESSLMLVTFAMTFALIKDVYENQSVLNNFDDEELKITTSKPIDNNFTNFSKISPSKSTTLNLEDKSQKVDND